MSKINALWPDWSYSFKAAKNINEDLNFDIVLNDTLQDVISNTIEQYYWIVPIHNKYWWVVQATVPMLIENEELLNICWISSLKIDHCLANRDPEVWIKNIKKVFSHPQALKQCKLFIDDMLFKSEETKSTTERISDIKSNEAIICSLETAKKEWLNILSENVAPIDNVTKFAFICNNEFFSDRFLWLKWFDINHWLNLISDLKKFMSLKGIKFD